jgi:predicted ATPase
MINKIAFKNYKLFKEKQSIELRPITVIIGKNNSGKSAVAKLPTLISGSLSGTFTAPIQLENEGVRIGNSYEDLFYNREITVAPLEFEIADDKESLKVSITGDNSYSIKISKFNYNNLGFLDISKAKFNGFVTKKHKSKALNLNFDYIESFRKFPDETFSDIFGEYSKLGISGENAYKLLAKYYKTSDKVLDLVSNWFEKNFEGWKLSVKDIAGSSVSYEVVLENKSIKPINIVNTGSGIRQSLPLIVRSFMPVNEEILIIIEEPETHLHPAAHGSLAERFIDSHLEDTRRRYLIETHSENFILRIQRLVASKKISVDDVALYYVDYKEAEACSTVSEIAIEQDGEVEHWPDNVFNESLDEVLKFRKAQKENQNAGTNS